MDILLISKGTRGDYINGIINRTWEAEFLLNRGGKI